MTDSQGTGPVGGVTQPVLEPDERTKHYVELWKQTVAVQQHFNDLEWRIRGLALTALTFTMGAAGVAAEKGLRVDVSGFSVSVSSAICVGGLFLWADFWFVDRIWYHRLLIGAVKHGEELEDELSRYLPRAGLTKAISKSSPSLLKFPAGKSYLLHSSRKLGVFYVWGAIPLVLLSVILWSVEPSTTPESTSKTVSYRVMSSVSR